MDIQSWMVSSFEGEEMLWGIKIPGNALSITFSFAIKNMYELIHNFYFPIFPYTLW